MKLFLDSANIDQIRSAFSRGLVSGLTLNPSLLAKEPKRPLAEHLNEIFSLPLGGAEIHIQADDPAHVWTLCNARSAFSRSVVLKAPVNRPEAMLAVLKLHQPLNATCIFTAEQAIAAAAMGARYVSFFWGRINDSIDESSDYYGAAARVEEARHIFDRSSIATKIIAGSIRTPEAALDAWTAGAHIVTTSLPVIEALFSHPGSDASQSKFDEDWAKWTA